MIKNNVSQMKDAFALFASFAPVARHPNNIDMKTPIVEFVSSPMFVGFRFVSRGFARRLAAKLSPYTHMTETSRSTPQRSTLNPQLV
jgi:hypothetical protein